MSEPAKKCPKHNVRYLLRRNAETGDLALACPMCDIEARGGTVEDKSTVAERIATSQREES